LNDDVYSIAAFNEIKGILESRSIRVIALLHSRRFWLVFLVLLTASIVLYEFFDVLIAGLTYVLFLYSLPIALPLWFGLWPKRPNVVTLKYRRESPTFWEDNLGDIAKWVVITVLAGILLLLATRAINQVWPEAMPKP
jgi:hypothetical protein